MAICGADSVLDDELVVIEAINVEWEKAAKPDSRVSPDIIPVIPASRGPTEMELGKGSNLYDEYKYSNRDSVIPINLEVDDKHYRTAAGNSIIKMSAGYDASRNDSIVHLEPEENLLVMMSHEELLDLILKASSPPLRSPPIMIYGAPGTGKTRIVEQAVTQVGDAINVYSLGANELKGAKKKDIIKLLEDIFVKASSNAPSVVFLDDVDLMPSRASKLLTINREGVQILAATNKPHKMERNILEAFVDKHHLSLPSIQTISKLFKTELDDLRKYLDKKEQEKVIDALAVARLSLRDVNALFGETLSSNKVTFEVFDGILEKLESNYDGKYFMIMHNWSARAAN